MLCLQRLKLFSPPIDATTARPYFPGRVQALLPPGCKVENDHVPLPQLSLGDVLASTAVAIKGAVFRSLGRRPTREVKWALLEGSPKPPQGRLTDKGGVVWLFVCLGIFPTTVLWVTMGGQWIVLPQKGNELVVEERETRILKNISIFLGIFL